MHEIGLATFQKLFPAEYVGKTTRALHTRRILYYTYLRGFTQLEYFMSRASSSSPCQSLLCDENNVLKMQRCCSVVCYSIYELLTQ